MLQWNEDINADLQRLKDITPFTPASEISDPTVKEIFSESDEAEERQEMLEAYRLLLEDSKIFISKDTFLKLALCEWRRRFAAPNTEAEADDKDDLPI